MRKIINQLALAVAVLLLFVGVGSATVLCDKSVISQSWIVGQSSGTIPVTCSNDANQSVSVAKSGNFFNINQATISPSSSQTILVSFDSSAPIGSWTGNILFNNLAQVSISMQVNQTQQQTGCQINPSLISYSQSIQKETQMPLPKITFSPTDCPGNLILTASSVSVQGGIITPSGQKPISIASVLSDGINLNIDTSGLASQTYSSQLNINAFSKQFQIPIIITVTTGTTPASNFSVSSLPTCSLTNTVININSTYSMVCTNIQPDITIVPRIDGDFIQGTGIDTTSNQYIWYFQAKKFGNTKVYADFYFKNAPVGTSYSQEVKVSSSGQAVAGTNLKIIYTPSLNTAKAGENVVIQLVDNKSNSLVVNPTIYIDALPLTNSSGNSFFFAFQQNRNYSMRATSPGYDDFTEMASLGSAPTNITISPSNPDSATSITISESNNATLNLDGNTITNPSTMILSAGNHTIKASKSGFFETEINFYVDQALTAIDDLEFNKGELQTITLSKNTTWTLYYQKNLESSREPLLTGTGTKIEFVPENKGIYSVYSGDRAISSWEIKGWDGKMFGIHWIWWTLGIVVVIFIFYMIRGRSSDSSSLPVGGNFNYG